MAETTNLEQYTVSEDQTSVFDSIAEKIEEFVKERQEEFKNYFTERCTTRFDYLAEAAAYHVAEKLEQRESFLESMEAYVAEKSAESEEYSDVAKAILANEISKRNAYIDAVQENYTNWLNAQNAHIDAMQEVYGGTYPDELDDAIDAVQELMASSVAKIQDGIDTLQEKVSAKWDEIKDGSITEITTSIKEAYSEWSESVQAALSEITTPAFSDSVLVAAAVYPSMVDCAFKNMVTAQIVAALNLA